VWGALVTRLSELNCGHHHDCTTIGAPTKDSTEPSRGFCCILGCSYVVVRVWWWVTQTKRILAKFILC